MYSDVTMNSIGADSGYEDEQSGLHDACESGTLEEIISHLSSETATNWFHDGQTPLHVAVMSGRLDAPQVLKTLIEHGADINAQTKDSDNTALHLVVQHGTFPRDFETIMVFLECGADLGTRNKSLRTAYDCALACGRYELAGVLDGSLAPKDARAWYKKQLGERYGPYIIEAVQQGDERKLHHSLDMGGDPNLLNKYKVGAIHYTVTQTSLPVYDTLALLLHHGADPNLQDEEGDAAINLVVKTDRLRDTGEMTRCVQLLVDAGGHGRYKDLDGKDAFNIAEEREYHDIIAILNKAVSPRQGPNDPNSDGLYPIHMATSIENTRRRHDRIDTLLEQGAHINAKAIQTGDTALHLCAEKDFGNTASLLLDKHIDYTIRNNDSKTAYDVASDLEHQSVKVAIEGKQEEVRAKWKHAGNKAKSCIIL